MFGLLHSNVDWILSGLIVTLGILVMMYHVMRGHILAAVLGGLVWAFVYSLHSGSTAGIMTATFAALLFDLIGLPFLRAIRGK